MNKTKKIVKDKIVKDKILKVKIGSVEEFFSNVKSAMLHCMQSWSRQHSYFLDILHSEWLKACQAPHY